VITVSDCDFYGYCERNDFWHWVDGSLFLTIIVDLIFLAIALCLLWGIWAIVKYFRRPFCYYCRIEGRNRRTKGRRGGRPICYDHWKQQDMAAEEKVDCPVHKVQMDKSVIEAGVIIDYCPSGCIFLNQGELNKIRNYHDDQNSSAMLASMVAISAASSAAAAASN
jgi:hypothetical protein